MAKQRGSKRSRKEAVGDSSSTLKRVLKLSAQEHADSLPNSPHASARSHISDDETAPTKKSRTALPADDKGLYIYIYKLALFINNK